MSEIVYVFTLCIKKFMLVSCQITKTNTVTSHNELINHGSDARNAIKIQM